jgi:tetratricopeptide (TPR) repeat protein
MLANIAVATLDFPSCLRETKAALALSPNDPNVLVYGSENLAWLESAEEGVQLADRGIALDPLNSRFYRYKSEALIYLRRYRDAIQSGRKALQLSPERHSVHIFVGDALLLLGQSAQAKSEYDALEADNPFRSERLALFAARTGDRAGAERMISQMKQQIGATASYQYGEIYAQLGDRDRAFAELDNAFRAKDGGLLYLKVDPFLDPIRGDPRYAALLRRLNFP